MTSFLDFYRNLSTRKAQKIMRERVIAVCEIKPVTFYSWLARGYVPKGKHQERIAETYGAPIEIFFPEPDKTEPNGSG